MLQHAFQSASSPSRADQDGVAAALPGHTIARDEAQNITSLLLAVVRSAFMPVDDAANEMPLAQLRLCTILFEGPRPMSSLSRELGISLSAMTQLADRLERAHLVKRIFEGMDRRVRCLRLTPRGRQIIHDREQARAQQISMVLEKLPPATCEAVRANLEKLLAACIATKDERRQFTQTKRNGDSPNGMDARCLRPLECSTLVP